MADAATLPRAPGSRLGEILVRSRLIGREQLRLALERQKRAAGGGLSEHLIALGYLTEEVLAEELGRQLGIPVVDPAEREIPEDVLSLVPSSLIRKHLILPLDLSETALTVAMADPTNFLAANEVKFLTGYDVRVTVASTKSIRKAIDRLLEGKEPPGDAVSRLSRNQLEASKKQERLEVAELGEAASRDAPLITFVSGILAEAIRRHASDVRFEFHEEFVRVHYRIDGVLHEAMKPPVQPKSAIVSRIEVSIT